MSRMVAAAGQMRELTRSQVLLADGRRIATCRWPGHGRPLVLLHGLLDESEGWSQLAHDTHRPCVALDLPGFGGSSAPRVARLGSYADDVAEVLQLLGLESCTLVGHSLGGAVAVLVAERVPAVHSLCLLAPAGFGVIRLAELMALPGVRHAAGAALPLALLNPLVVTGAYATVVSHRRLPSRDLLARLRRRAWQSGPGVVAAVSALADAGRGEDAFHRRRIAYDGPVAALWGARDGLVPPEHAEAVPAALPQAHVAVWHGMGHHPQRERPAQLARFIERRALRARRSARAAQSASRRERLAAPPIGLGVPRPAWPVSGGAGASAGTAVAAAPRR